MSKVYEQLQVPSTTITECTKRKCDLCGTESYSNGFDGGIYKRKSEYGSSLIDAKIETIIILKETIDYSVCDSCTKYSIDLCPECFKSKLIPWLESQGAEPEIEDYDL